MMKRLFFRSLILLIGLILALATIQPPFWRNIFKKVDISPQSGATLVEAYNCRRCHQIGRQGALMAPVLDGVTIREELETLQGWLENPRGMKANTAMPDFKLSDTEVQAILAYLQSLAP